MSTHYLKTWPRWFQAVWDRKKLYEVRHNDRHFYVGDILQLQEFDPETEKYTGREVQAEIMHILSQPEYPDGLRPGYGVLGLTNLYNRLVGVED